MDEEWPNAPSLEIDAWFLEILFFFFFWKDDDDDLFHFFWKMNEAGLNAPSLEMDEWFLEILGFFFFENDEAWLNAPSSTINVNFENSYCVRTFNKANLE